MRGLIGDGRDDEQSGRMPGSEFDSMRMSPENESEHCRRAWV